MNKFEQDLQAFFPEIYELHKRIVNNRQNWEALTQVADLIEQDRNATQVIEKLWQQHKAGYYGQLEIVYQNGKVNKLYRRESIEMTNNK
jgi:hypothetical protein